MATKFKAGARPTVACEISSSSVIAGRSSERGSILEVCAARDLSSGSLAPDLMESNLLDRRKVLDAIQDTLGKVGGRSRDLIAVLPDAAVRAVLLEFDSLPSDHEDAEGVVRFRLKKSLPFDVDKARVSFHAQSSATGVRVIAAVALLTVIEEYETLFRDAGYNPGIVLPSMLAALGAADADRPTMIVKVDGRTASLAILEKNQLLLFRTIENPHGTAISGEQLAEEIYPSVVFFQDTYQLNLEQIFVAGLEDTATATPALQSQTGAKVDDLVASSQLGANAGLVPRWKLGGVTGALLG
jgi:type IV pilus assembly protein PilM